MDIRPLDIFKFLAETLEGRHSLLAPEPAKSNPQRFEIREGLVQELEKWPARTDNRTLMTDLAPYFGAGFYLTCKAAPGRDFSPATLHLNSMFLYGRIYNDTKAHAVHLSLPNKPNTQVYRGRVQPVLSAFGIQADARLNDGDAFAFHLTKDEWLVLVCNRPFPWQVDAIEALAGYFQACADLRGRRAVKPGRFFSAWSSR